MCNQVAAGCVLVRCMANIALTMSIPQLSMNSEMQHQTALLWTGKPDQHAVHLDHARFMDEAWPDVKEKLI
jgi:hypothetical protein